MRSKLKIITMGWYDAVTFDLIRHAIGRDTFPSRGRHPSEGSVHFYVVLPYTPSVTAYAVPPPPTRREPGTLKIEKERPGWGALSLLLATIYIYPFFSRNARYQAWTCSAWLSA